MFRFLDRLTPDHVEAIAAFVQMEMLEAGYATNVEFHYLHHQPGGAPYANSPKWPERIAAATARTGIGLTLLPVHYQFGGCDRRPLGPGQVRFGTDPDSFARLHAASAAAIRGLPADAVLGVAPHTLRAVAPENLPELAALAPEGPIHMHLAEQVAEVGRGRGRPRRAAPSNGCSTTSRLDARWYLIHCTQMEPHETAALARSGATAGLCPITEANLGDGIFDGVRWLSAGGRIAVGSDSQHPHRAVGRTADARILPAPSRPFPRDARHGGEVDGAAPVRRHPRGRRRRRGAADRRDPAGLLADLMALDGGHVDLEGREGDTILDAWIFAGDDRMVRRRLVRRAPYGPGGPPRRARRDRSRLPRGTPRPQGRAVTIPEIRSWQAVQDEVRRRIAARIWRPGDLIPHETDLAREFGCARATVNRALRELAGEGLLDRRRKAGTRVAVNPVRRARFDIPVIRDEIEARGRVCRHMILSRQLLEPPPDVSARMGTGPGEAHLHMRTLYVADGAPYVLEDRWINPQVVPAVLTETFGEVSPNEWLVREVPFEGGDFTLVGHHRICCGGGGPVLRRRRRSSGARPDDADRGARHHVGAPCLPCGLPDAHPDLSAAGAVLTDPTMTCARPAGREYASRDRAFDLRTATRSAFRPCPVQSARCRNGRR